MDTTQDMLFDITFCILGKLYELYKNDDIDFDTFINHTKVKIQFLNNTINPACGPNQLPSLPTTLL